MGAQFAIVAALRRFRRDVMAGDKKRQRDRNGTTPPCQSDTDAHPQAVRDDVHASAFSAPAARRGAAAAH